MKCWGSHSYSTVHLLDIRLGRIPRLLLKGTWTSFDWFECRKLCRASRFYPTQMCYTDYDKQFVTPSIKKKIKYLCICPNRSERILIPMIKAGASWHTIKANICLNTSYSVDIIHLLLTESKGNIIVASAWNCGQDIQYHRSPI